LKANALRFDIYLPIYYNEKDSSDNRLLVEEEKFLITYEELQNKFRGISVEDNPIRGSWLNDDGIHFDDESTVYHVLCKLTIDNLQWLGNSGKTCGQIQARRNLPVLHRSVQILTPSS